MMEEEDRASNHWLLLLTFLHLYKQAYVATLTAERDALKALVGEAMDLREMSLPDAVAKLVRAYGSEKARADRVQEGEEKTKGGGSEEDQSIDSGAGVFVDAVETVEGMEL